MNKQAIRILTVLSTLFVILSANADFRDPIKDQFSIYSTIPFIKAANFKRYSEIISRNINQERNLLQGYLSNLVYQTGDLYGSIDALKSIEQLSRYSTQVSTQGFSKYFSENFIGSLSDLYRQYNLNVTKLKFISKKSSKNLSQSKDIEIVAAATFSIIQKGRFFITLKFIKLNGGQVIAFNARGSYKTVIKALASKVFNYFESKRYIPINNPFKNKAWLTPFFQKTTKEYAVRICENQGARLPTAFELTQGHILTTVNGGINLPRNIFLQIKNTNKDGDNLYYYTSEPNSNDTKVKRWVSNVLQTRAYFVCIKDL